MQIINESAMAAQLSYEAASAEVLLHHADI
jgi:hypothetical protein